MLVHIAGHDEAKVGKVRERRGSRRGGPQRARTGRRSGKSESAEAVPAQSRSRSSLIFGAVLLALTIAIAVPTVARVLYPPNPPGTPPAAFFRGRPIDG